VWHPWRILDGEEGQHEKATVLVCKTELKSGPRQMETTPTTAKYLLVSSPSHHVACFSIGQYPVAGGAQQWGL